MKTWPFLKIDDQNEIYYEYVEPKDDGYTFVFRQCPNRECISVEWRQLVSKLLNRGKWLSNIQLSGDKKKVNLM